MWKHLHTGRGHCYASQKRKNSRNARLRASSVCTHVSRQHTYVHIRATYIHAHTRTRQHRLFAWGVRAGVYCRSAVQQQLVPCYLSPRRTPFCPCFFFLSLTSSGSQGSNGIAREAAAAATELADENGELRWPEGSACTSSFHLSLHLRRSQAVRRDLLCFASCFSFLSWFFTISLRSLSCRDISLLKVLVPTHVHRQVRRTSLQMRCTGAPVVGYRLQLCLHQPWRTRFT